MVDALHQRVVGLRIGRHGHGDGQVDVVVLLELAADFGLQLSHSNLAGRGGRAVCEQGGVYQKWFFNRSLRIRTCVVEDEVFIWI